MLHDFFLGFVRIHILHHAAQEPVYGLALIEELRRHGYGLSSGTLYPVLHQLEGAGYLRHNRRIINGKVRKYYIATDEGRQVLQEARHKIGELVREVLASAVDGGKLEPMESRSQSPIPGVVATGKDETLPGETLRKK